MASTDRAGALGVDLCLHRRQEAYSYSSSVADQEATDVFTIFQSKVSLLSHDSGPLFVDPFFVFLSNQGQANAAGRPKASGEAKRARTPQQRCKA